MGNGALPTQGVAYTRGLSSYHGKREYNLQFQSLDFVYSHMAAALFTLSDYQSGSSLFESFKFDH